MCIEYVLWTYSSSQVMLRLQHWGADVHGACWAEQSKAEKPDPPGQGLVLREPQAASHQGGYPRAQLDTADSGDKAFCSRHGKSLGKIPQKWNFKSKSQAVREFDKVADSKVKYQEPLSFHVELSQKKHNTRLLGTAKDRCVVVWP